MMIMTTVTITTLLTATIEVAKAAAVTKAKIIMKMLKKYNH